MHVKNNLSFLRFTVVNFVRVVLFCIGQADAIAVYESRMLSANAYARDYGYLTIPQLLSRIIIQIITSSQSGVLIV